MGSQYIVPGIKSPLTADLDLASFNLLNGGYANLSYLKIAGNTAIDVNFVYFPGTSNRALGLSGVYYNDGSTLLADDSKLYGGGNQITDANKLGDIGNGIYFNFTGGFVIAGTELFANDNGGELYWIATNNLFMDNGAGLWTNSGKRFMYNDRLGDDLHNTVINLVDGSFQVASVTAFDASGKLYGLSPVADATYTVGLGVTTNGTITTVKGIITAITEAT